MTLNHYMKNGCFTKHPSFKKLIVWSSRWRLCWIWKNIAQARRPSGTLQLSLSISGFPQHTTWPSDKIAANEPWEARSCRTPFSCSTALLQSPPVSISPHATTLPSAKIAPKAPYDASSWQTSFNSSWTSLLSPPVSGSPQVTTDPFAKRAANALLDAAICCTCISFSWTMLLSPPNLGSPQVTTLPSVRIAANEHQEESTCCTSKWERKQTGTKKQDRFEFLKVLEASCNKRLHLCYRHKESKFKSKFSSVERTILEIWRS